MVTNIETTHGPALAAIALDREVTRQQVIVAQRDGAEDVAALLAKLASLERSEAVLKGDSK